jgi:Protein of unknown function (DUF3047)
LHKTHKLLSSRLSFNVLLFIILLFITLRSVSSADSAPTGSQTLLISDFSQTDLHSWQSKVFDGVTQYEVVQVDNRSALKAVTDNSASALYKELHIDLEKTPFLNWSWRVDNLHSIDDQKKKSGDDFPARLYVVVKFGPFPWQTKAVNYVWSNSLVNEDHWANPFTANAVMIPVKAGKNGLGQWHHERVNVKEDFYRVFNLRITTAHAVAIMSDSDNASGRSVAFYGPIQFTD